MSDFMKDVQDYLNLVETNQKKLIEMHEEEIEKRSQIDRLLSDIYHEIEFEKLDAVAMMRKFKELQALLKVRRKHKNQFSVTGFIARNMNALNMVEIRRDLRNLDDEENTKTYSKRIGLELRQEILSEIENL